MFLNEVVVFAYILFPQSGGTFKAFVENVKADGTA